MVANLAVCDTMPYRSQCEINLPQVKTSWLVDIYEIIFEKETFALFLPFLNCIFKIYSIRYSSL